MKKLLCIVLAALMLVLPACGTTPAETTPVVTTPANTTPATTTPIPTTPATTTPIETTPIVTTPAETPPITTTPVETTPAETTPIETTPVIYSTYQSADKLALSEEEKETILRQYNPGFHMEDDWYDEDLIWELNHSRHYGWRYYGRVDDSVLFAMPGGVPGSDGSYSIDEITLYAYKDSVYTLLTKENCTEDVYREIENYHAIFEADTLTDCSDGRDPYWFGGQELPPLEESPYTDEELQSGGTFALAESYLGTYNGYSVYFVPDMRRQTTVVWIDDVPFHMGDPYVIKAYKDGVFEFLTVTYENGNLTHEDLLAIAYYMYGNVFPLDAYDYEPKPSSSSTDIPTDQESDLYYLGGQNLPPLGASPYSGELLAEWGVYPVFYLGIHNGYAVYEIKTSLRGIGPRFIGGVPFWWGEVQAVACKDGAVYSLSVAYEEGILTYGDLRAIAWYWYGDVFPKDGYIPIYSDGYHSPEVIYITDAKKAAIEAAVVSKGGTFKWFDKSSAETWSEGWRYYGYLNGDVLVGKPYSGASELDRIDSLSSIGLYHVKNGQMDSVITQDLENETVKALEEYILAYENTILQYQYPTPDQEGAYPPIYPPNLMTVPDLVEELSEDQIQEFALAWYEKYGYQAQWFDKNNIVTRHFGLRYYGTHEGYMVFYRPNDQGGGPWEWEDGKCEWLIEDRHNLLHGLYYYKDGEIEEFLLSYPVSDEAFSVITQIHKTIETEIQSREDLDDPLSHDGAWYPPIDRLDGCGTYHGYLVDGYTTMLRPYGFLIVGGSALYIGGPDFFTVSGNGIEPMSIEEAFYRGYLTVDDIKAVAYYYYGDGDPYID